MSVAASKDRPGRQRHRLHGNPFTVRGEMARPDWQAIYGRTASFALDVGFGAGGFLLELAALHPEWNVLGLEIREHLVEGVLAEARARGLANVHALRANANIHTDSLLPDASVAFVAINFPDPWYKKRHHKRRVVNTAWVATLARKLEGGAEIHAMSDYQPIGIQMREVFEAHPGFVNVAGTGRFAETSTTGIATEREVTHTARNEPIFRMRFRYEVPV